VLTLPIGEHEGVSGVVDLWTGRAHTAAGESDPPAAMAEQVAKAREQLVENAAECDDAILEKYLEEGELSAEDLRQALVTGTRSGAILPVLCGSASWASPRSCARSRICCPRPRIGGLRS
jgi:elongation factor G